MTTAKLEALMRNLILHRRYLLHSTRCPQPPTLGKSSSVMTPGATLSLTVPAGRPSISAARFERLETAVEDAASAKLPSTGIR